MDLSAECACDVLARLRWDLFGTLTFRASPRPRSAMGLVWRHMGHAARLCGQSYSRLLMAVREERGGLGGRLHFHYLLGGTFHANLNTLAARLTWDWRTHGFASIRSFDNAQRGVAYVTKCLGLSAADSYELARFGRVPSSQDRISLTVSRSVARVLAGTERIKRHGTRCTSAKTGERRTSPPPATQHPVALASSLHGGQGITL
jgi:hypothetical protein